MTTMTTMRIAGAVLVGVAALGAQQRPLEPTRVPNPHVDTMRPAILGTHGIVAAGRHYSVAAGVRILQQGGNAVDAGVASVFAASVC
jgi:gamma-glutamyltranspeptidase/glutathione hydrolase